MIGVASLAESFGKKFGAGEWAEVAGLWHDLGKYSPAFQRYLALSSSPDSHEEERTGRIDHSTAGAQHAVAAAPILGHLLAYVIAGHHSGLLDAQSEGACLAARLIKRLEDWTDCPKPLIESRELPLPPFLREAIGNSRDGFSVSFFVRMLYSCLVDADFLDTEAFANSDQASMRPAWPADAIARMAATLAAHIRAIEGGSVDSAVNRERSSVLRACVNASSRGPGLFSLTVPTGGGKTLSSLAFALEHARRNGMERVVFVVPFTSIIEQNADVYRRAFAPLMTPDFPDPVIEHHSALDVGRETAASRLAAENWDAPLIVTTAVQFYESLFANRSSRCRKLHNLASAVIILDEAQTIPVDYLAPCLRALRELARNYRATVVLCTATQPAVHLRDEFPIGLNRVDEIIQEPERLYSNLRRVTVEDLGVQPNENLVARLREHDQVLCVVNTRGHARNLFEALGDHPDNVHLSALMCPEHRTAALTDVRRRLADRVPCRVISTQLIEAGVDVDFPVVYRSLAGIDSIAQAAGRCNRNGRLPAGRMYLFRSEHVSSERFFRDTTQVSEQVLRLHSDPLSLEAIQRYFQLYYWDQSARWDAKQILGEFHLVPNKALPFIFGFATVDRAFQLIEDFLFQMQ